MTSKDTSSPLLRNGPSPESIKCAPSIVIQPSEGLFSLDLGAIWHYRELLYFLVWRDVQVRYKQTAIGVGWAILQPLMTMVIFTVIFGNFAKIPSDGLPYPVFAYTALLPWTYFAQALSRSGTSLVGNANLITKVYFPRLLIPLASVLAPASRFLVILPASCWVLWSGLALRPPGGCWPCLSFCSLLS